MAARLLPAAGHRRMAWKNGLGETIEIAVFPAGAGLSAFGWRVSMAQVAADGPFSSFPGVDRTLAILSGEGVRLVVGGRAVEIRASSAPFSFPADAATQAVLLGGTVTDLNVMTRRADWTHLVRELDAAEDGWVPGGAVALAFCAAGEAELSSGGATYHLGAGDALLVEEAGGRWRVRQSGAARLCAIAIDPVAPALPGKRDGP